MSAFRKVLVGCSVVAAAGVAAASAPRYLPPDDARERGLGDLRRELELSLPVGRVVTEAGHAWLAHAPSGLRLCQLPESAADWKSAPLEGSALLFEGAPGAALVFDHAEVGLARFDRAAARLVWSRVFVPPLPPTKALLATGRDIKSRAAFAAEEVGVKAHIDLAGRPEGAFVTLTSRRVVVRLGAKDDVDAEVLFESGADGPFEPVSESGGPPCTGHFKSSVERATLADGTTVLRFESSEATLGDEAHCKGESASTWKATRLQWVAFGPHGGEARLLSSDVHEEMVGEYYRIHDSHSRSLDVPGGKLSYSGELEDGSGYGEWTWTLTPEGGTDIVLASGY